MTNKATLMRAASRTTGLSLRDTAACIESIFETIGEAVSRGDRIELRGFGTFFVRQAAAKKVAFSNNATAVIPAHGRIFFRPAQKLRESVWNNTGDKNKGT